MISKAATESGSSAKLICRAQGTPNVTFAWKREGLIIDNEPDDFDTSSSKTYRRTKTKSTNVQPVESTKKYIIEETKKLDLITYQSVLIINDVASIDYGAYNCLARNDLGLDEFSIILNQTSKPDPPRLLRVVNVTSGSVTLRWTPGFDGGLGQTFRVRYKPLISIDSTATAASTDNGGYYGNDPSIMYRDIYPPNATTAIIGGLRDNTEYLFTIMATNEKGDSDYSDDVVKAATLKGI